MTPLTAKTIDVLEEILAQCSISLAHPDFEAQAARLARAKRELVAARAELADNHE